MRVLLVLALLFALRAEAVPVNGQDYLALQHPRFRFEIAAKLAGGGFSTGNLDWTFGKDIASIERMLSAQPKFHRVHIINGVCIRNGNCGSYEIGAGYSKASFDKAIRNKAPKIINFIRSRVTAYRDLCARFPVTQCLVSPVLEHDLSKTAYRILADQILSVWPQVQLVNSPDGGVAIEAYRGAWIERHGTAPQSDADIVSTDGAEVSDTNVDAFLRRTNRPKLKVRYAWSRVYNCRSNGPFLDPRKRTDCPSEGNFEELAHILDVRAPVVQGFKPPGCKSVKAFAAPRVFKPMADDHGIKDPRRNKPVILIPSKYPRLDVISASGAVVGSLPLYKDPQPHDMERFYSGSPGGSNVNGYEFEKRANGPIWLRTPSNACLGPIVGGRRNGTYRTH